MNAITTLQKIRDLAQSKVAQIQPLAGEEMTLPQTNPHRAGFVDGERTLAQQIIDLIDQADGGPKGCHETEPVEEEMVLSLGRT